MTEITKDEQVGMHKGALSALAKEREGLMSILSIVEQQMQGHIKALKDLGIDLNKIAKEQSEFKETRPIDELV